jgi:hypothetical protein
MGLGPARDIGPAIVVWGATTIAEIFDEVRWTLTGENAEVFEALYGATPVDTVFLGYSACEITVPATRIALATLATLLPGGTNSGGATGAVQMKVAGTGAEVGRSMYDNGLPLFIKPIVDGVAAANGKWLRLEHTYPTPNFDVTFNLRDQRAYGLTFKAHPDATTKQLWSIGKVATGASY